MKLGRDWDIHTRTQLISVGPALLMTLLLTGFFTFVRLQDLRQELDHTGQLIASQLAPASEYGVISGNTQVLETLAKTGAATRAEITDAAMGVRAECVMLNKGPYITQAIRTLDDILQRMGGHQAKKRPLLRALKAWGGAGTPASGAMLGNLTI